ncbi:FeoB-associated Cys-rich membrane protein [Pelagicoccus sp. SDUM812005]|uniref:FeoB-associated Cys-rich membrane protein n=1 Tax=Pelagicoccus sp. SDUM812005 TaxID=3041257 RepID=UPI00280C7AA9|nr:FeoB-associated Cys-rich membrane protein [Pelagicoccus sp. SDUM812005]MDQ8181742.1 FeoB-associated Cys-rich membrane protein [Pelagicoccus sp. SDUM812005]
MESTAEPLVVALIVLLAGAYLGRRYLLKRRKAASGSSCAGSCGCGATKPKAAHK